MKLKPIEQQVVTVVGASSGIGRETALQFAKRGAKLVVSARTESGLASLVQEITNLGAEAIAVPADIADFEQVQKIAAKTIDRFGQLDTWVNAAATAIIAPFEQVTPEEFKRVIEVNLMGPVYGAMVAMPLLRQTGRGAIITISSVEARRSMPLQSSYSASKHGLEGFMDALRAELKYEGFPISITNILPSVINTPFYNKARTKLGVKPTGVPPYYQPKLVADAILHAAEHPTRDMIVGDVGRVADFLQKIAPDLVDTLVGAIAIPGQRTNTVKAADDPNNLFEPIEGYSTTTGDFTDKTIPSFLDWFDLHPAVKWSAAAGLGALALIVANLLPDLD
ncbi:SDR family oxidoreductase [Chamaesiphon sp. VAR_48_metabat_403]|uniref:SDR family oxidoreductase n=1 Tax=Chamaesiphon sp. VAR_48_metabat_403 TaxID=2964700 RepID=UPI00286DBFC7|nr:SDR family oxidoreductase [Chamaesiphon sp. VAR_48_metabat_403]